MLNNGTQIEGTRDVALHPRLNKMENKFRYELKMVFDALRLDEVRSWVYAHSEAFTVRYPSRQVNNIYFDSIERNLMMDHINGIADRAKVRFRWYGESWVAEKGQLEIKIRRGQLGHKKIQPISTNIDVSELAWREILAKLQENSANDFSSLLDDLEPVLINQYRREYYESMDGTLRITLDYEMRAYEQSFGLSPNISFEQSLRNDVIIEVKAMKNNYKKIADALAEFPVYCTQNSKYLNGMEYAI